MATRRTNNADMVNFAVRHKLIVVPNVLPELATGTQNAAQGCRLGSPRSVVNNDFAIGYLAAFTYCII